MGEFGNYERAAMFCWVCDTKKLPEDQKKWELEHYQKAIEGVREWQNNPENSEKWRADVPLPKMQERMKKYVQAPVYGTPVLMRFSIKTFNDNKKGYGNLNCGEMDELLTTLDQCAVDIAAASAVDGKTFGLLTSTYPDAKHPLDLLNDERIDEWKEYMTKIRQKVNSGEVKLPDQLIKAYEKDLPRFLATPAFTREPATAQ
jgi:hypothetical protein